MKKIAIVGLGIVGGSFAKAIHAKMPHEFHVMGIDIDSESIKKALDLGVIQEGETHNSTILQRADIVIIALYPMYIRDFLASYGQDIKEGALVTEATGIKQSLIDSIHDVIPSQIDFIMGHPMAGRESKGFDYSDGNEFNKANYIITPQAGNKAENIDWLSDFMKSIGFGRVTLVSPEKHDEMIAYTSQLCHVIASALINSDNPENNTVEFVGDSFRELTRIANMNETLWSDLMLHNSQALLDSMNRFEESFTIIKQAIEDQNKQALEAEFIESTQRRKSLEKNDLDLSQKN